MIGIILTGHGNFATGVNSAVELIGGKQENYELVDFPSTSTLEDLQNNLKNAMEKLKNLDGVLVLCDLVGGSPFKTAVECSVEFENVTVVGGVSLPAILEVSMMRNFSEDSQALMNSVVDIVKNNVQKYEFKKVSAVIDEDGI